MKKKTSKIPSFYKLNPNDRLYYLKDFSNLSDNELSILKSMSGITLDQASNMIENAIGGISIPIGLATNYIINSKEFLIPMAIEESSVIAASSKAAGIARSMGGFKAKSLGNIMRSQIQLVNIPNINTATKSILEKKSDLLNIANKTTPTLHSLGSEFSS